MNNGTSPNSDPTAIQKSQGSTRAERYVKRLCDTSFLSLWSYSNVYRLGVAGDCKEVCDVLVVFQEHIIIFSDKDCAFPNTGNMELDWKRWFRRAVHQSAKQLWGAERWIKECPQRLFLDSRCTQPFPLDLPDLSEAQFHRILIAHGASERCREVLGGSSSLGISPEIIGDMHYARFDEGGFPFIIGQIDPARGYIHIFDDTSLDIVMHMLDTISDFVTYLTKKELFIRKGQFSGASEEDVLAFYLQNRDENGECSFTISNEYDDYEALVLAEDLWEGFVNSDEYKTQVELNKISYEWDRLIELFNSHILNDTLYYTTYISIAQAEKSMRFLARESRLKRRILAQAFTDFLKKTPSSTPLTRVLIPETSKDPYYVFVLFPRPKNGNTEKYRRDRLLFLNDFCLVTKLVYPEALDIIGIATEAEFGEGRIRSEDFSYYDARNWTEELQTRAGQIQRKRGFYTNTSSFPVSNLTRPINASSKTPTSAMKGRDRNKACSCGSGKKRKNCCG